MIKIEKLLLMLQLEDYIEQDIRQSMIVGIGEPHE